VKLVDYTKRFIYLSNQWYNDGLKRANIRDLSGAITSLKKSLQYNRDNVAARNLLGLVYFGRGEVSEALVEWIISKNIKTHGNIATYYIKKVQESPSELEVINQAVKKYNQCLVYCEQGGEDLAAIQLQKVVAAHPTFLKAYQLLALIYIHTEQYAKARQALRRANKLDSTNETTLRYMHYMKKMRSEKTDKLRDEKSNTVSYKLGNETIIQPVSSTLKDNATFLTILNILIGVVLGAACVWFLFMPTLKQDMTQKSNQDIISYSEQIAARETEIDLLNRELETFKTEQEETAKQKQIAMETKASYEALVEAMETYAKESFSRTKLVDELLEIKTEALGEKALESYEKITSVVFEEECAFLYDYAQKNFVVKNYQIVVERMERVMEIDSGYADGAAMLLLMETYHELEEAEKAESLYQTIKNEYPDTEVSQRATQIMTGQEE
jgi:tetratricopeptide (TPR) repeat protein